MRSLPIAGFGENPDPSAMVHTGRADGLIICASCLLISPCDCSDADANMALLGFLL